MILRTIAIASIVLVTASAAHAQQRPLLTEDPETVGTGRILVEAGLTDSRDRTFSGSGLSYAENGRTRRASSPPSRKITLRWRLLPIGVDVHS